MQPIVSNFIAIVDTNNFCGAITKELVLAFTKLLKIFCKRRVKLSTTGPVTKTSRTHNEDYS